MNGQWCRSVSHHSGGRARSPDFWLLNSGRIQISGDNVQPTLNAAFANHSAACLPTEIIRDLQRTTIGNSLDW